MSRTYTQIINSVYSAYHGIRCRSNPAETPEQSKLSLDTKFSHLLIPYTTELLNGSLSKSTMITLMAEAVYDESPDMALFLNLLFIPIEDAKLEEHSPMQTQSKQVKDLSASKFSPRKSSAKLDKLIRDQNRDAELTNRSIRQQQKSMRNSYVLQKGVSTLLLKILDAKVQTKDLLYKHACTVDNCERCLTLFKTAPITECKSIHGGEACNEIALYPHVTKLVHDDKNLSVVTSSKSWLNPLTKQIKTSISSSNNMLTDEPAIDAVTHAESKSLKRKHELVPYDYKVVEAVRKKERYEMYTMNIRDHNFPRLLELAKKECIRLKRKGLKPLGSSSFAFKLVYQNPAITLASLKSDLHAHANTALMSRHDKKQLRKRLKLTTAKSSLMEAP